MNVTVNENLRLNYEKGLLGKGREVLARAGRIIFKGVEVGDQYDALSTTQKRKKNFNPDQIKHLRIRTPLEELDVSNLHDFIKAFGPVPSTLYDWVKQLKDKRNEYEHEKQNLALDKTDLACKLGELKVIMEHIFEELKNHCSPIEIPSLDNDIIKLEHSFRVLNRIIQDDLLDDITARQTDAAIQQADLKDAATHIKQVTLDAAIQQADLKDAATQMKQVSSDAAIQQADLKDAATQMKQASSDATIQQADLKDAATQMKQVTLDAAIQQADLKNATTLIKQVASDAAIQQEDLKDCVIQMKEATINSDRKSLKIEDKLDSILSELQKIKQNVGQNGITHQGEQQEQNSKQVQEQSELQGDQDHSSDIIPENIQQDKDDHSSHKDLSNQCNQKFDIQQHQPKSPLENNDSLSKYVLITRQYNVGTVNLNPMSIINESAAFNCVNVDYNISTESSTKVCNLFFGGIHLASSKGKSKKEAKDAAAAQGLVSLKAHCYTLKVLKRHTGEESVTVDSVEIDSGFNDYSYQEILCFRLRKMFGYTDGTEITKTIKLETIKGSQGVNMEVGGNVTDQFKQSIEKILHEYETSDRQDDLIFSPEFSKEQRKKINLISLHMNLKGQSTGSGNNRFITISRKNKVCKKNVLQYVLQMVGDTEKYKLLKPDEPWYSDE